MTAMPDHHGGVDDDTADLGPPIHHPEYDAYDDDEEFQSDQRDRLRPSALLRRVHGVTVCVCYMVTVGSAAWLLAEAILHTAALIMLLSVALLAWLLPDVPRLLRWVRTGQDTGQTLPASWQAQLVVGLLTALNLFLLVYARL